MKKFVLLLSWMAILLIGCTTSIVNVTPTVGITYTSEITATLSATPSLKPTITPFPSATLTKTAISLPEIRSCLDLDAQQREIEKFIRSKGFVDGDGNLNKKNYFQYIKDIFAQLHSKNIASWVLEPNLPKPNVTGAGPGILISHYPITLNEGKARCILIAYEDFATRDGIGYAPLIGDVERDGLYSDFVLKSREEINPVNNLKTSWDATSSWLNKRVGQAITFNYFFAWPSNEIEINKQWTDNAVGPLVRDSYVTFYGNNIGNQPKEFNLTPAPEVLANLLRTNPRGQGVAELGIFTSILGDL